MTLPILINPNQSITEPNPKKGGDELCANVTYLGSGGQELLVNKRLTVGFLSQNHTEADIGACVFPAPACPCISTHTRVGATQTNPLTPFPPKKTFTYREDAGALPLLHLRGGGPLPLHALGPARRGGLRPQRAVSNALSNYNYAYMYQ